MKSDVAEKHQYFDIVTNKNSVLRRKVNVESCKHLVVRIFLLVLMVGLAFLILFPFLVKLSSTFMSVSDTYDSTVGFIPRHFTLANIEYIFRGTDFLKATWYTLWLSLMVAVGSVISSSLIGYGLAKFKFKGAGLVLVLVVLVLLIPPQTIMIPMYTRFRYFLGGTMRLTNTMWPMAFMSITDFGFRGGLYILIMRQVYKGIPNELAEAAKVDGASTFRTYISVMLPLSKSMLTVVLLFAFSWQWTDTFYSSTLFSSYKLLPTVLTTLQSATITGLGQGTYTKDLCVNAFALLAVMPLLILFVFVQKKFVQGIESSGIVG